MHRLAYIGLAMAALAGAAMVTWFAASPRVPDRFYAAEAGPGLGRGSLLASERFERGVPAGARAYRILFTTTRADGGPAVASGLVIFPSETETVVLPVIAWAHGTTGIARGCAPSLSPKPFANVPTLDRILAEGWAFVATDYVGLGSAGQHAYLVGPEAAHSVIDAVRAARQITAARISSDVVAWGHSQGGHSALWVGSIAASYAPELSLKGVVAFAPASDLQGLVVASRSTAFGKIVTSYLVHAFAAVYPDVRVEDYVNPWPAWISADIGSRCMGGWPTLLSVVQSLLLPSDGIFIRDPTTGALGDRLNENTPRAPIPSPLFILQGGVDDLVLPKIQDGYVKARCAGGQGIEYKVYADRDHISLVEDDSPAAADALIWSKQRLSGRAWRSTCDG